MSVHYLPITIEDIQTVTRLYVEHLNAGNYIEEHIREGMEQEGFVGIKAVDQSRIIGMLTGRQGIDFTYPHPELEAYIHSRFDKSTLYTPDSLYVEAEYREHDVARQLGKRLMHEICQKGYKRLLTELWIYPNGKVPAEATVREWGNVIYNKDIPMFYKDGKKYGIECPKCGKQCNCGARILVIDISEKFMEEGGEYEEE